MTPAQRAQQIVELTRSADAENRALDGLLGAWRGDRLVGAVWGQIQPAARPPSGRHGCRPANRSETADALLGELLELFVTQGLKIAQALLRPQDQGRFSAASRPPAFGTWPTCDTWSACRSNGPRPSPLQSSPTSRPASANIARLKRVIEQTFEQTLDCPGLSEIRNTDDLLTEYRAIGQFDPALWLIVRQGESDIGCLLLANHPEASQWELVYVGIARGARGRGRGLEIVRRASGWRRRAGGREFCWQSTPATSRRSKCTSLPDSPPGSIAARCCGCSSRGVIRQTRKKQINGPEPGRPAGVVEQLLQMVYSEASCDADSEDASVRGRIVSTFFPRPRAG